MAPRIVVAALVLSGCGSGVYRMGKPACESDYLEWAEDPVRWVGEADGDGAFSVSPGWSSRSTVTGSWDPETRQYQEEWTPAADHYVTEWRLEGTLDLLPGGDVRLTATEYFTDILDEEFDRDVQFARIGCTESWRYGSDGAEVDKTVRLGMGEIVETSLSVDVDSGYTVESTRVMRSDGTAEETSSYSSPDLSLEGTAEEDWFDASGTSERSGEIDGYGFAEEIEYWHDGDAEYHVVWELDDGDLLMDYELDYAGDGGGTVTLQDGTECGLRYEEFERSCDCGDGWESC